MAYGLKYFVEYPAQDATFTARVEILTDGYVGGSAEIDNIGSSPVTISRHGGCDKDVIIGSELQFSLLVTAADADKYDALMESDYKENKIIYKEAGVKLWEGYLNPQFIDRELTGEVYELKLSAVDGLAELKDNDYLNAGEVYTDRVSILTVVKRCLDVVGIGLDFRIQLGTYEDTAMLSTDCALDKVTIDNRRFIKVEAGRQTSMSCFDVLSAIIKIWDCTLSQSGGYYWINNEAEGNSFYHQFTYSTLAFVSRTASDLRVNIDTNYPHYSRGNLSKVAPIEKTAITFRNRNLGDSLLGAGTVWSSSQFEIVTWTSPETLYVSTGPESAGTVCQVTTNDISVTKLEDGDKIALEFAVKINTIDPTGTTVNVKVELFTPEGNWIDILAYQSFDTITRKLTVSTDMVGAAGSGNYKIRLSFKALDVAINGMAIDIDNITFYPVYTGADVTFDRYMEAVNTAPAARKTYKDTILFADAGQDTDIGALKISGVRTDLWRRYGKTDDVPILKLLAFQKLISFQSWRNNINVQIKDISRNLSFHGYIIFETKLYRWKRADYDSRNKVWSGELIEVLTADVSYTGNPSALGTVDGQASGDSVAAVIPVGSAFEPSFSILSVGKGGTGRSTLTLNYILLGNDSSPVQMVVQGSAFNKAFAGTGAASTVARSDHNHDSTYSAIGHTHTTYALRAGDTITGAFLFNAVSGLQIAFNEVSTDDSRGIGFNGRAALTADSSDGYLRLNNGGGFTNGIITPGNLRIYGSMLVDATRGLKDVTGDYGTVQTVGTGVGSYQGYSIGGRVVFMHNGSTISGLYDDVNSKWLIRCDLGGSSQLYHNGALKVGTSSTGANITGNLIATGEVEAYDTSDRRLKENIRPLPSVLDAIKQFTTARFWHKKKKREDIGLIAQEVQQYFPEVVKEDQDGFLMINYGKLSAVYVRAIQELDRKAMINRIMAGAAIGICIINLILSWLN